MPARAYPQQAPGPEASHTGAPSQYGQAPASQYHHQSGAGMAAGGAAAATAAAGAGAGGYSFGHGSTMDAQSSGQNNKDWVRLVTCLLALTLLFMLLSMTWFSTIDEF